MQKEKETSHAIFVVQVHQIWNLDGRNVSSPIDEKHKSGQSSLDPVCWPAHAKRREENEEKRRGRYGGEERGREEMSESSARTEL